MSCKFHFHPGALDNLQLMELGGTDWKAIDEAARVKHHLTTFSRQSEDEMSPHINSPCGCHHHRLPGCFEIVPPIDSEQGVVIAGLYAIFNDYNRCVSLTTLSVCPFKSPCPAGKSPSTGKVR